MNPITVVLDVLVLALLGWALGLGLTLNKRLKALREGQADFAKAVGELNEAARRAESGLAELRRGAEETMGALQERIEVARGLVGELERAASHIAARAPPVSAPRAEPPAPLRGAREKGVIVPPSSEAGGLSPAQRVTRGQVADTAPAGFAEMIRRTLREAR